MRLPRAPNIFAGPERGFDLGVTVPTPGVCGITAQTFSAGLSFWNRRRMPTAISVAARSTPKSAARRPKRSSICPSPAPHSRQVNLILGRQNFGTQAPPIKVTMRCCIRASAASRILRIFQTRVFAQAWGCERRDQRIQCDKLGDWLDQSWDVSTPRHSPAVDRARGRTTIGTSYRWELCDERPRP